ncbi:unnamed protein product [Lymnaea stagnalis]|uniref:Ankyrin repeat-containing protein n=1 Tax=Lymnaea stagnalis TaxID=6523 RepID=A0AAV2HUN1_LYMST
MNQNKETALTLAMTRGANPILKDLIMAGAFIKHPKAQYEDGRTALMIALQSYKGSPDTYIQPLIGDSCNVQDTDGKTALMYAMSHTCDIPNHLILQMIGDSQNIQDNDGKTALMYAFIHNKQLSEKMIERLNGGDPLIQDKSGKTALMYALQLNRRLAYKEGKTALMYALTSKTRVPTTLVMKMIGNSHNLQDKDGKTALMYALQNYNDQSYTFIDELIAGSSNIQDKDGKTALMYALIYARNIPVRFLKQLLCPSQNKHNKGVRNALVLGSERAVSSTECSMGPHNGDLINVQDSVGKTALHYAIEHGQDTDYMKCIVLHGANLEVQDNKGQTALMLCVEVDTRVIQQNGYVKGLKKHFRKTITLLRCNAIPILNSRGKEKIFSTIKNGLFNSMNLFKNKDIFRLIIANGVVPFPDFRFKFSTLSLVLKHNQTDVTKYVIANMCLTNDDLKMMKNFKNLKTLNYNARNHPHVDLSSPDLQHLLSDATSQPWPLVKLSFIAVNSAVGHGVDREHRIKMLPLPNPIKDMLMFNTRTALLPVSEWANIPMIFDPAEYEKTSRPRPLLNYWPFGEVLVV